MGTAKEKVEEPSLTTTKKKCPKEKFLPDDLIPEPTFTQHFQLHHLHQGWVQALAEVLEAQAKHF